MNKSKVKKRKQVIKGEIKLFKGIEVNINKGKFKFTSSILTSDFTGIINFEIIL